MKKPPDEEIGSKTHQSHDEKGRFEQKRVARGLCALGVRPAERAELAVKLRERFIEQSPLKTDAAKEAMAESLAMLLLHQAWLFELLVKGEMLTEEARTIPGVASNIKRLCDALKITEPSKKEVEDL